jgi:hypothetical protein
MMHMIADMRGNLLTSQFKPPFDTIWPIAMLNPAGLYLWAFAVVKNIGKRFIVQWHYNIRDAEEEVNLIKFNSRHIA